MLEAFGYLDSGMPDHRFRGNDETRAGVTRLERERCFEYALLESESLNQIVSSGPEAEGLAGAEAGERLIPRGTYVCAEGET